MRHKRKHTIKYCKITYCAVKEKRPAPLVEKQAAD